MGFVGKTQVPQGRKCVCNQPMGLHQPWQRNAVIGVSFSRCFHSLVSPSLVLLVLMSAMVINDGL